MLVTRITTHVQDGLDRLSQQYKDRPRILAIHTAIYEQIQDLEDAIFAIDAGRQLWNGSSCPAIGQQLDNIGTIVGIDRNGLSDAEYLLFIFGKIAENFSDTTLLSISTVIGYIFQADQVIMQELPPAGMLLEAFGSNISEDLYVFAKNLVKASMGGGIELVFASASPDEDIFSFDGPNTNETNGFSDVNDPLTGGKFIGTI
jgi:predicted DNA-binding protein